ncbi:nitrilase family protein [Candidatus Laterigemmans baculatus]|uniref:nitrilase family protein n=1 Tax=Candidatus Laterigemmans baculatus TaxID=2770505 RepID=UPI0013DA6A8F|nr:nitrilase family protein [Candidatus Laterigemmans baculatus]
MQNIRAAAVQFQHVNGDKRANLATMQAFIEQASRQGVQMLVFPECCVTGYWFLRNASPEQLAELSEPVPDGPTTQWLCEQADRRGMLIGAGLIERDSEGRLYNSYIVALPGGAWHCHRKLHCFVSAHMHSGDRYTVFDTPWDCRVGVLICYDNNLVENARATALLGAEVLLAPHQTGGCRSGSPEAMGPIDVELWENRDRNPQPLADEFRGDKGRGWLLRWLPARAHDNGMFLIFSNGVGRDDDEVRTGNAMILDPYGRILRESQQIGDDMVVADLIGSLRERSTGARWMRARRPDLYKILAQKQGSEVSAREARFS